MQSRKEELSFDTKKVTSIAVIPEVKVVVSVTQMYGVVLLHPQISC